MDGRPWYLDIRAILALVVAGGAAAALAVQALT